MTGDASVARWLSVGWGALPPRWLSLAVGLSAVLGAPSAVGEEPRMARPSRVINIGIHVGGGPFDDETKEPIKKSVRPHFDALALCFEPMKDEALRAKAVVDVGVDLRIPAKGGTAAVSHPRTSSGKGLVEAPKDVLDCVVATFEKVEFLRPKHGLTVASYSLRFVP